MGFFRENGSRFLPRDPITTVSFLRALLLARDGDSSVYEISDDEVLNRAVEKEWISEKPSAGQVLNRASCARIMIRFLNLEQVAGVSGIYINQFKDLEDGSDLIGIAALLKGLGVVMGTEKGFEPKAVLTRAEAAQFVYRMAGVNLRQ